tara:strand:+ start:274 stop:723 length:450 start_codon:yes stop_codon:yes gene_type:complete
MNIELTEVPSELIRLAVKDARLSIEQGLTIDMDDWKSNNEAGEMCSVCFAGAVMLHHENMFDTKDRALPSQSNNRPQYLFLDKVRSGYLKGGLQRLLGEDFFRRTSGVSKFLGFAEEVIDFVTYDDCENPEQFFLQMEEMAEFLETQNL